MPHTNTEHFNYFTEETLRNFYGARDQEVRAGEKMLTLKKGEDLGHLPEYKSRGARFVLFGVPESVGPMANMGLGGSQNAWYAFLSAFAGMQHNRFLNASTILCLGNVNVRGLESETGRLKKDDPEYLSKLRKICEAIDDRVLPVVKDVLEQGMTPVLIGGGHNNAYPLLKGTAEVLSSQKGANCINCDPHADYKPLEGRHSGNGFSYAKEERLLNRYAVTGLHRNYNAENMLKRMDTDKQIWFNFFEDIIDWNASVDEAIAFLKEDPAPVGLELDMDSIAYMPVSAFTPGGITLEQARSYLRKVTQELDPVYLHLPEGAPLNLERDDKIAGKALAFLVADFIHLKNGSKQ